MSNKVPIDQQFQTLFDSLIDTDSPELYKFFLARKKYYDTLPLKITEPNKFFVSQNNLAKRVDGPNRYGKKGQKGKFGSWFKEEDEIFLNTLNLRYNATTTPELVKKLPQKWDNNRPVIGVLTQDCNEFIETDNDSTFLCPSQEVGYASTNYVKFVESRGASAYIIPLKTTKEKLEFLMNYHLSGIILPGGPSFEIKIDYIRLQRDVFDIVKQQKIPIPILGVCMGFQKFIMYETNLEHRSEFLEDSVELAQNYRIKGNLKLENVPAKAVFNHNFYETEPFPSSPEQVAFHSHRWYLTQESYQQHKIYENFDIVSTSTMPYLNTNISFINTIQHKTLPFIGTSWHPKKPGFEKNKFTLPRKFNTKSAIEYTSQLARFFVNLCRQHPNVWRLQNNLLSDTLERNNRVDFYSELVYA